MTAKKEASQGAFQPHPLQQAGRIDRHVFQRHAVHFHLSPQQRPGLHTHAQVAQGQQGVRRSSHAVRRLYHPYAPHQQVQRETQVYPLHGKLHTRGLARYRHRLATDEILHRRHIEQHHEQHEQGYRREQHPQGRPQPRTFFLQDLFFCHILFSIL